MTDEEAYKKIVHYCNFSERCHLDVRLKLAALKVFGMKQEEMVVRLIEENLLNELRYATALASGKFRINHWGKYKIKLALQQKQISAYCIRKAIESIDPDEYREKIKYLIEKRKAKSPDQKATEIVAYLAGKGFEPELVSQFINDEY